MCLGKCIYSIEGRESYKLWISHLWIAAQLCDLYWTKTCHYFVSRIKFLHWCKLEGSEFRSLLLLLAEIAADSTPAPSLPITHFGHGSENRQCQNGGFEASSWGMGMALTMWIRNNSSHLRMWFQPKDDFCSELESLCLSHYLWVWRVELRNVHFPRWSETRKEDKREAAGGAQM